MIQLDWNWDLRSAKVGPRYHVLFCECDMGEVTHHQEIARKDLDGRWRTTGHDGFCISHQGHVLAYRPLKLDEETYQRAIKEGEAEFRKRGELKEERARA